MCTTVCGPATADEGTLEGGNYPVGSAPGQLNFSDELAIDNDPTSGSYGAVYVVDQRNFRVMKFSAGGVFELMFGGEVDRRPMEMCAQR